MEPPSLRTNISGVNRLSRNKTIHISKISLKDSIVEDVVNREVVSISMALIAGSRVRSIQMLSSHNVVEEVNTKMLHGINPGAGAVRIRS